MNTLEWLVFRILCTESHDDYTNNRHPESRDVMTGSRVCQQSHPLCVGPSPFSEQSTTYCIYCVLVLFKQSTLSQLFRFFELHQATLDLFLANMSVLAHTATSALTNNTGKPNT